ncbi:RNA methyltransferase [bacterium]|nr:RNA methyltransferase [bacterium]
MVDLQSPNNLGAIIRSIFAFNIDGLFLIGNCVDIFHPEVIRASMGYVFQIPVMFFKEFYSFLKFVKNNKINLLALANKKNALALNKYKMKTNNCFLLGNEGNGLKKEIINQCHQTLKIEIENVESLNVIAVASIISYYLKHENNKN